MACNVATNRHKRLRFRLNYRGREWTEGIGLTDTPKNRMRAEARAVLISEEMEHGEFDYLRWFPYGNRAHEFNPKDNMANHTQTVGEYFKVWIESKKPPAVRAGLERDYRAHFKRYILPRFENVKLKDVEPRKLLEPI